MSKGDFLLGMAALCLAVILSSFLIATAIKECGKEIAKAISGVKFNVTVPQNTTKVEVIREGLPLPITREGL